MQVEPTIAPLPAPLPAPAPAPEAEAPPPVRQVPATASPAPTVQLVPSEPGLPPPAPLVPPAPGGASLGPSLALPSPSAAAAEVVDTRPPRPPGVGPSITPAPVVFSPVPSLPTLPALPPSSGPVAPEQLAAPGFNATCLTVGEVLARIPEASNWTQLLGVRLPRKRQDASWACASSLLPPAPLKHCAWPHLPAPLPSCRAWA